MIDLSAHVTISALRDLFKVDEATFEAAIAAPLRSPCAAGRNLAAELDSGPLGLPSPQLALYEFTRT